MARDDAEGPSDRPAEVADRPQDPLVGRLRPDPSQPPEPTVTLTGFFGESDRGGFRRLYFTRDLDYYAEFRAEDVLHTAAIPADQQPFAGEEATHVSLRRAATVEYTRVRTARPIDEFDIDVRLGGRRLPGPATRAACQHTDCDAATCGGDTQCGTQCVTCGGTCETQCVTCETECFACPTSPNFACPTSPNFVCFR